MIRETVLDGEPAIDVDTEEEFNRVLGSGVWVIAPPTADVASWHPVTRTTRIPLRTSWRRPTRTRRRTRRQPPPAGLSGVCGPGSKVEQGPVPIAL